jgi:hypothetical protein
MKIISKFIFIAVSLITILSISGCKFNESDNLYNFEKPYVGIYQCESINIGGKEFIDKYSKYTLELKADGEMYIKFKEKESEITNIQNSSYILNEDKIILNEEKHKKVIYQNGKIIIFYDINRVPFIAKFGR